MFRFPPTRIAVCEEDLSYHLQRILVRYRLDLESQWLCLDHDDSSCGYWPAQLNSYPSRPQCYSSSDVSGSDSETGFDLVPVEIPLGEESSKENGDASVLPSRNDSAAHVLETVERRPFLVSTPIASAGFRARRSESVVSYLGYMSTACRVASTTREWAQRRRLHMEEQSIEAPLSDSLPRTPVDSDSPAAEEVLGTIATAQKSEKSGYTGISSPQPERSGATGPGTESPSTNPFSMACAAYEVLRLDDSPGAKIPGSAPGAELASDIKTLQTPRSFDVHDERLALTGEASFSLGNKDEAGRMSVRVTNTSQRLIFPAGARRLEHSETAKCYSCRPSHAENSNSAIAACRSGMRSSVIDATQTLQYVSGAGYLVNSLPVPGGEISRHGHPCQSPSRPGTSLSTSIQYDEASLLAPNFEQILAESKKLRRYLRSIVADLEYVHG